MTGKTSTSAIREGRAMHRRAAGSGLGPRPAPAAPMEFELQQSGTLGHRADEALKRIARQHPRRDIPRVESVEPEEAPLKE